MSVLYPAEEENDHFMANTTNESLQAEAADIVKEQFLNTPNRPLQLQASVNNDNFGTTEPLERPGISDPVLTYLLGALSGAAFVAVITAALYAFTHPPV